MTDAEVDAVRLSIRRDCPFGGASWTTDTAKSSGWAPVSATGGINPPQIPLAKPDPTRLSQFMSTNGMTRVCFVPLGFYLPRSFKYRVVNVLAQ